MSPYVGDRLLCRFGWNFHSNLHTICSTILYMGHAVMQLVEALRYKSEGPGFDFRWWHWIFSLT
jgi:hypothetical protein